ncbi:uncharacterized protein LOC121416493 [Lytechinus variegatus]|uniref:uncharacterized protein LOC121416493 n=1 Tax=Lytechinus variegatus TaxID=7654 RepID=UPI001BB1200D|nr:uncharacterized protein LOC121416493 [Lytechinus variegatus]
MSTSFTKPSGPARIMVWSTPRSVSTALARSMSARGDTEMFWEPYLTCYNFGPKQNARRFLKTPDEESMFDAKYTYSYISGLLNNEYPGAKVIFAKCMVEGIRDDFSVVERNFKHSFLIRHPKKAFRSMTRLMKSVSLDQNLVEHPYVNIYDDLERFYRYVESALDQPAPPIIDADDLVSQPEKLLSKYCDAMGIAYTPKMLEWESVDASQLNWHCADAGAMAHAQISQSLLLSNALKGVGFGKAPDLTGDDVEIPPHLEEIIENSLPAYEKLYALRIKP